MSKSNEQGAGISCQVLAVDKMESSGANPLYRLRVALDDGSTGDLFTPRQIQVGEVIQIASTFRQVAKISPRTNKPYIASVFTPVIR